MLRSERKRKKNGFISGQVNNNKKLAKFGLEFYYTMCINWRKINMFHFKCPNGSDSTFRNIHGGICFFFSFFSLDGF